MRIEDDSEPERRKLNPNDLVALSEEPELAPPAQPLGAGKGMGEAVLPAQPPSPLHSRPVRSMPLGVLSREGSEARHASSEAVAHGQGPTQATASSSQQPILSASSVPPRRFETNSCSLVARPLALPRAAEQPPAQLVRPFRAQQDL